MKKNKKILDYIPWLLLFFSYTLCVILNAKFSRQILDSDMASEMVLANLLNEEGSIISNNWFYSSELRVLHMQLLFKLGLKLFPNNWNLIRVISQCILMALYACSIIYCSYGIGFKQKGVYLAAILLLPISLWNTFHNYFGGFYLIFAIPTLFLVGTVFKYANKTKLKFIDYFIQFVIGIIIGINGIKVLLYFAIPNVFIAFIIVFSIFINNRDKFKDIKNTYEFRYFVMTIINVIGLLAGYKIYNLLCNSINYISVETYTWQEFSINNLLNNLSSFLMNLGYPSNDYFGMNIYAMSLKGLLGVFGVLTIIIFVVSFIRIINKYHKLNIVNKTLFLLSTSSIALSILVMSCLYEETNASYFLPVLPFAFIIIELEIENEEFSFDWFKNIARLILVFIVLLSSIPNVVWFINKHPRRDKDLTDAIEFLDANNINCIYAEFWDSNVVTELSNGDIEAYTVVDYKTLQIYDLLQRKDHVLNTDEEIYVLINGEIESNKNYSKDGFELIYCNEYSIIKAKDASTYLANIND